MAFPGQTPDTAKATPPLEVVPDIDTGGGGNRNKYKWLYRGLTAAGGVTLVVAGYFMTSGDTAAESQGTTVPGATPTLVGETPTPATDPIAPEIIKTQESFVVLDGAQPSTRAVFETLIDYSTADSIAQTGPGPATLELGTDGTINAQAIVDAYFSDLSMANMTQNPDYLGAITSEEAYIQSWERVQISQEILKGGGISTVDTFQNVIWGKALSVESGITETDEPTVSINGQAVIYLSTTFGNSLDVREFTIFSSLHEGDPIITGVDWGEARLRRANQLGDTPYIIWGVGEITLPYTG